MCFAGFELVHEGLDREFKCDGLSPGHTYRVRVACSSVGGQSEVSMHGSNIWRISAIFYIYQLT